MISFYPGPSRIHDDVPRYVRDAARDGILSFNHRSPEFVKLSKRTAQLLKQRLGVPADYIILYTSSATECWEIIAQSYDQSPSTHFFNGAFGQKWFDYTRRLKSGSTAFPFDRESLLEPAAIPEPGIICVTQNETSNGTQVRVETIHQLKSLHPGSLIAVDATSSMAGIQLDFSTADVWYASVQKCFGLPAGMGIMLLSPTAVAKARSTNNTSHYNSLPFMLDMAMKWQTSYTPNVLNIYLLMRTLEKSAPIRTVHKMLKERYLQWCECLEKTKHLKHLVDNPDARSCTVVPVEGTPPLIKRIKREAKNKGFILGEGYGVLKDSTFRIANFPAIREGEVKSLMKFISGF